MSSSVEIFEVGPRDGLQNEKHVLSVDDKVWLIEHLFRAGIKNAEAGAFVRADKIPQMADSELVHQKLNHAFIHSLNGNAWYLVPNLKGLERAHAMGVSHIALFTAVSDTFNKKNIGMTVDESFLEMKKVLDRARTFKMKIRGYVSTVWGCPFEGRIDSQRSLQVIDRIFNLGVDQVSIGDTIGVAAPTGVTEVLKPLLLNLNHSNDSKKIAVHFHDTRGTALANSLRALDLGVRVFDSSIGGLGGCPFAPGASGNLATEDLAYLFKEMGIDAGLNYRSLCETSIELFKRMSKVTGSTRPLQSKAVQAFLANCAKNNAWDS